MLKAQPASSDSSKEASSTPAGVIQRVRGIVQGLELDCECRNKLDGALQRFKALEDRRQLRRLILDARHQAECISALLDLSRELDELMTDEPDLSVFEEIALRSKAWGRPPHAARAT